MENNKTAVALGMFDGVHLGHRAVLRAAFEQKKQGLIPCAFTFPPESTANKGAAGYIYSESEKSLLLSRDCGIERVFSPRFEDICGMDGGCFAQDVLCGEMNAAFVCCGRDFRFGRGASCGTEELSSFGEKYGFTVQTVEDVFCDGERVSSTAVRQLLAEGELDRVNAMLGRSYIIAKEVAHGAQLGRTIGFPTANQLFDDGQLVPKYGGAPLAETYIHGFSGDLYGSPLTVELCAFIRPEKKFGSLDKLKEQINADIASAINIL